LCGKWVDNLKNHINLKSCPVKLKEHLAELAENRRKVEEQKAEAKRDFSEAKSRAVVSGRSSRKGRTGKAGGDQVDRATSGKAAARRSNPKKKNTAQPDTKSISEKAKYCPTWKNPGLNNWGKKEIYNPLFYVCRHCKKLFWSIEERDLHTSTVH